MTDKIKLEDMTLGQIRELKSRIIEEIYFAINKATSGYDVGDVFIEAEVETYEDACGTPYLCRNPITIKFSKENEQHL